jgi:hypothetical protein
MYTYCTETNTHMRMHRWIYILTRKEKHIHTCMHACMQRDRGTEEDRKAYTHLRQAKPSPYRTSSPCFPLAQTNRELQPSRLPQTPRGGLRGTLQQTMTLQKIPCSHPRGLVSSCEERTIHASVCHQIAALACMHCSERGAFAHVVQSG